MGVRGVSRLDLKANSEPGTAEHGLPQALGTPASPCERRGGCCSVQKKFSAIVEETAAEAPGKPIEIWFQDEARVGQNKITRRWAKRGTRPSAPRDQRTASAYIFGAICPAEGKGAGLVLPSCDSEEISIAV